MNNRSENAFGFLRYYAAFCVMYLHFTGHVQGNLPEYAGELGILRSIVDFFQPTVIMFAISGFLISASLERSGYDAKTFIKKRFFRLYPDLWLSMLIYLGVFYLIIPKKFDSSIFKWLLTQGVGFASTPSCFKKFGTGSINGPLWYITVLLQLYIIVFLFKKLTREKRNFYLYAALSCVLAASNIFFYFIQSSAGDTIAKLIERFFLPYAIWFFVGVFFQTFKLHEKEWRTKAFIALLILHCFFRISGILNIGYYTGIITGISTACLTILAAFIIKPIKNDSTLKGYTRKNVACDILAPSAVAEGNIFLSRECASIAERFLSYRKSNGISYMIKKTDLSYGMYLYHWLFLNIIIHYKLYLRFHWIVCLIMFTVGTILFSFVFRYSLLKQIPVFRKN
ncbi:acyltransferase family protein [Butyrivibrio sp. WCE2006]|uniref:acyltransferase family protein n=1 Tax=Butyrivibrio sp. WCE2006 TaxID=1410611 RepID=UPI00067895FF|nr:acyltransferase [Butyrivibrio sp. WCE2006]